MPLSYATQSRSTAIGNQWSHRTLRVGFALDALTPVPISAPSKLSIGLPLRGALRQCWIFWLWRRAVNRDRGGAIAPLALFGVEADIPPCSS
jgi:hypothetical protein